MGRIICAWCGKTMKENVKDLDGDSHGICEKCSQKEHKEITKKQKAALKKKI